MFKTLRRLLFAGISILALALPAVASAHVGLRVLESSSSGSWHLNTTPGALTTIAARPRATPQSAPTGIPAGPVVTPEGGPARLAGRPQVVSPSSSTQAASRPQPTGRSFNWGDAAMGAGAVLLVGLVLGLGLEASRRRSRHQLVS